MKTYSVLIVLLVGLLALPCMAADVEEVEVTGQAAIFDDDKAQARDKAIDDALRKAVESAVGTKITSTSSRYALRWRWARWPRTWRA